MLGISRCVAFWNINTKRQLSQIFEKISMEHKKGAMRWAFAFEPVEATKHWKKKEDTKEEKSSRMKKPGNNLSFLSFFTLFKIMFA